ncbi:MAG: DHH family phosphoesterase [Candidatus Pacebacteria bacterium]|jgi:single-stranded-DNA-specific exonuclease|nr:DHH family phosphoesterase [Candidatus Paceibacterota bacterium]
MENGKIKNLAEAAQRIKNAARNGERSIIYGDTDLDGVAAAIMAGEIVKNAGGKVAAYYFPNREKEGYGITKEALKKLEPHAPALLIAVDLGIGNFEEVKLARAAGFSTLIVDHHEILDGLPQADIVVDPKQPGDSSPFKFFAAAGLVFKLAEETFGNDFYGNFRQSFAELAALATLADMMPREAENTEIIEEGLATIRRSFRPGLRAFFDTDAFFENDARNFNERIAKIITVLNVRDFRAGVPAAFKLLTTDSMDAAKVMIREFLEINKKRRENIDRVTAQIESLFRDKGEPIIFEGNPEWDSSLMGTIASILNIKYGKPVFIYKILDGESQGTVRSTDEVDSVALMKKCKDLLVTFGGHPKASGFRVKNENLEKFKICLVDGLNKGAK